MKFFKDWQAGGAEDGFILGQRVALLSGCLAAMVVAKCPAAGAFFGDEQRYIVRWIVDGKERHANVPGSILKSEEPA